MTRIFIGIVIGFIMSFWLIYQLDNNTWNRALASFVCGVEGRENVYISYAEGSLCADLTDAYPSDDALQRVLDNLRK